MQVNSNLAQHSDNYALLRPAKDVVEAANISPQPSQAENNAATSGGKHFTGGWLLSPETHSSLLGLQETGLVPQRRQGVPTIELRQLENGDAQSFASMAPKHQVQFIKAQELFLEHRYTEFPDTTTLPAYQPYAEVWMDGALAVKLDNNGYASSQVNSLDPRAPLISSAIRAVQGNMGPSLAANRAEAIAQAIGGEVRVQDTALEQQVYTALPAAKPQVNREALQQDPQYIQLQQLKASLASMQKNTAGSMAALDTSAGVQPIDMDAYFADATSAQPLLQPTAQNIEALAFHASAKFERFLAVNNIPQAPSGMYFDAESGKVALPETYAQGTALKQALKDDPAMERELRSIQVLASHYAAMRKSVPFAQEYRRANTQEEVDAVVAKYSYLFDHSLRLSDVRLRFSQDKLHLFETQA